MKQTATLNLKINHISHDPMSSRSSRTIPATLPTIMVMVDLCSAKSIWNMAWHGIWMDRICFFPHLPGEGC